MKILIIHNSYAKFSGEEAVVAMQRSLLERHGHQVLLYERGSSELEGLRGKIKGFFCAFYNRRSIRELHNIIAEFRPDVAIVHNLFPLVSPAVLPHIRRAGVPIAMIVHNYRLLCPNGLFFTKGKICEKCLKGRRELNCVVNNCEDSFFKSVGYALRSLWARMNGYFDAVDIFVALTDFQKGKLVAAGIDANKIKVVPNAINTAEQPATARRQAEYGDYVGYVGRISKYKGIDVLLEAARLLPDIPFRLAGKIDDNALPADIPQNVTLCGQLEREELPTFYVNARIMVMTSILYEGFPVVLLEAMLYRTPVIAQRLGGVPEIIQDGYNGLLFKAGDGADLARRITSLWNHSQALEWFAREGYEKVFREYSADSYAGNLTRILKSLVDNEIS